MTGNHRRGGAIKLKHDNKKINTGDVESLDVCGL